MALTAAVALLAAWTLATDPPKQAWDEAVKADVTAEVLPRSARVEVDGKLHAQGFVSLEPKGPGQTFRIRASADGFEPEERVVEAARVENRAIVVVLRPVGFGRPLAATDAAGMALAADALLRAGRLDHAAEYAERSLAAGNTPLANRVLGDVWRQRGDRDRATRYYTMYLSIAEKPPDGPEIRDWLLKDRPGDITIPAQ